MRIIQVLDALDYGDGVSNDVIAKMQLLESRGFQTEIYSKFVHEKVQEYSKPIEKLRVDREDILIHHFSGKSLVQDDVLTQKCKKILVYHNITPPQFFDNSAELLEGFEQIRKHKEQYDYFIGDSQFNIEDLRNLGVVGDIDLLPILIDFKKFGVINYQRVNPMTTFLFVGRIAPNKKIEDIIDVFEYYYTNCDSSSMLNLVGNYEPYMDYFQSLQDKLDTMNCRDRVIFTGKVSEEELQKAYCNSDIFMCMSEHEGFCLPLLESMHCGEITIAYDACAVKETMGDAGILVSVKDYEKISKLIYCIMNNPELKQKILTKELEHVKKYSEEEIGRQLERLIEKWRK